VTTDERALPDRRWTSDVVDASVVLIARANRGVVISALAVTLTGPVMGCSVLFVNAPPPPANRPRVVECTSSNVAPIIDSLIAGWQVLRIGLALAASDADYTGNRLNFTRGQDIALGAGLLTIFGISATWGFFQTAECREALNDNAQPMSPPRARPPQQTPTPTPPTGQTQEEDEESAR